MDSQKGATEQATIGYFSKRLQEVVDRERKDHGLFGLRLFPAANYDSSLDDIAGEAVAMHESFLSGNFTELTGQEI